MFLHTKLVSGLSVSINLVQVEDIKPMEKRAPGEGNMPDRMIPCEKRSVIVMAGGDRGFEVLEPYDKIMRFIKNGGCELVKRGNL